MKKYSDKLSVSVNRKGVLDVDTVKGCTMGMRAYPQGGCYGLCYAYRNATFRGIDFSESVSRVAKTARERSKIRMAVDKHYASWFRIGCAGDPSHDWENTLRVCSFLHQLKTPIIVTKHWIELSDEQLQALKFVGAIVNTSVSPLDTTEEISHRISQFTRLASRGVKSVLRIVSCRFGDTEFGASKKAMQEWMFSLNPHIDNPLRIPRSHSLVRSGDIIVQRHVDLGGGSYVSIANQEAYVGTCYDCPDQCGMNLV